MFPNPIHNNYHTIEKPVISSFPFAPISLYNDSLHNLFFSVPAAADGLQRPLHLQPPQPLTGGRRRQQRKDRHSKICTAQGLRDRRMRLSLDVACKFFDLQDLLGFDRASKTVQWLLKKSKHAIKEIMDGRREEGISIVPKLKVERVVPAVIRTLRSRPLVQPKVARESREKARARARERTLEKKKMRLRCGRQEDGSQGNKETFLQAITFSGLNEESCSLELKSSLENCTTSPIHSNEAHHNGSTALFDYIQTAESLFQEPWETDFLEIYDERVLGDLPAQMSYERQLTPPVFDYV